MAGYRPEFRKSWRFLHFFRFTISKGGFSFGTKLGPLSKSWGTRQNRTTIDGPGHFGLEFRKVEGHGAHHGGHGHEEPAARSHGFTLFAMAAVIVGEFLVLLARIHLHPFSHCRVSGHPDRTLGLFFVAEIAVFAIAWNIAPRLRGILFLLLALGACYLQWRLFGAHIAPDILCRK